MTTSTIVLIVVVAVAAILLIAAIAWVARNKRTQHRRVEAGNIRDKAAEAVPRGGATRSARRRDRGQGPRRPSRGRRQGRARDGPTTPSGSASQRRGHRPRRGEPGVRARRHDRSGHAHQRRHTATRLRNPRDTSRNPRRQARPTPDAQIRVTSRTPTPGLGRVIADAVAAQVCAAVRVNPPGCVHVTCDISHSSTAPDVSSGRLGAAPNV